MGSPQQEPARALSRANDAGSDGEGEETKEEADARVAARIADMKAKQEAERARAEQEARRQELLQARTIVIETATFREVKDARVSRGASVFQTCPFARASIGFAKCRLCRLHARPTDVVYRKKPSR